jgi:2-iminobutanoate/2-iminopropanoate deaminase
MKTPHLQGINPSALSAPGGHYSHGVVAGGFVFVSGQLPITAAGVKLVDASFEEQAQQVLDNVRNVLEASGSSVDHLVQVRVYVASLDHWPAFNQVYSRWVGEHRPARAVVPTGPLHHGLLVEVEAVAIVP